MGMPWLICISTLFSMPPVRKVTKVGQFVIAQSVSHHIYPARLVSCRPMLFAVMELPRVHGAEGDG